MKRSNKQFYGRKVGMTQVFTDSGECVAVTVIDAPPVYVVEVKTRERNGYSAVKVAFDDQKEKRLTKPALGVLKKAGVGPKRTLRELRMDDLGDAKPGDELKVDRLEGCQFVDVIGLTKGRGFAGVVKRHGFAGAPASHGQTEGDRVPGSLGRQHSIGQGVHPGKKMAGRLGNERCTVKNLELIKLDPKENLIFVRGAVPGPNGGLVLLREGYRRRFVPSKTESPKKKKVL